MPSPVTISKKEARLLALSNQGLLKPTHQSIDAIKQIGYIQIDTISVTERAHHHVFFSRNPKYQKSEIDQLMDNKEVFEYWSHAAAYLPMRDFRYSLYRKNLYKKGENHWFPRDKKVEKYVLNRIKAEGALQSKDFENSRNKNHEWYEWKPAKIALTNLFMDGSLMIANRKGFQKIFDLTERVIPTDTNTITPTLNEYCNHLIFNTINAHGLSTINEIIYLRKGIKPEVNKLLKQLVESGEIIPVNIIGSEQTYYTTEELLSDTYNITSTKRVHLLSPFDNVVIQRKRLKELFDFEYLIECYVPEKKRVFGYYTIPILYGDVFVARMDAKADRKIKLFTVKNIWLEPNFKASADFTKKLKKQLNAYATFCGCEEIVIEKVHPKNNLIQML